MMNCLGIGMLRMTDNIGFVDRSAIDKNIKNFDLIVELSIQSFSKVWGGLFRNKKLIEAMSVRCNTCFTRLYFEDLVRYVYTIKKPESAFSPIFYSIFKYLLDYNNSECIYFYGKIDYFNFAILNKKWFLKRWSVCKKSQFEYNLLINNKSVDCLPEKVCFDIIKKPKNKHTKTSQKRVAKKLSQKFNDNYVLISTLLKRFNCTIVELSELTGLSIVRLKNFCAGTHSEVVRSKIIDLYHINNVYKIPSLLKLTKKSRSELSKKYYSERDVLMSIKMFCLEYCDILNTPKMLGWHEKRLNKKINKSKFEEVFLYLSWVLDGYKNNINKMILSFFSFALRNWCKTKTIKNFKNFFITLDTVFFQWECSLFLSRNSTSFFVEDKFSCNMVGNRVVINKECGRINLASVRSGYNKNEIYTGNVMVDKSHSSSVCTKKSVEKKHRLFSECEIERFKKLSIDELEDIMDKQSDVITGDEKFDQEKFNQLIDVREYLELKRE